MRFVLVHGANHGAWCWDLFIPEVEKLGHEAIAVDLPGHGARHAEYSTLDGYRQAVVEALQPGDVLVGHSMGAAVATTAADAFPEIGHIIYLTGPLPVEGKCLSWELGGHSAGDDVSITSKGHPVASAVRFSEDSQYMDLGTLENATAALYHDCAPDVAAWAYQKLTPQNVDVIMGQPISVPTFWEADLPRSYIRCTDDRGNPIEYATRWAQRLGVEPLTIATSHSPFLSRPAELAQLLLRAIETVPVGRLQPHSPGPIALNQT